MVREAHPYIIIVMKSSNYNLSVRLVCSGKQIPMKSKGISLAILGDLEYNISSVFKKRGAANMTKLAFDNDRYLQMQSAHIRDRIAQFGGKLYLEFGGKLYDDNHASRVLPGFQPDSKLRMLLQLKDQVEMVIAINADDIEKNKVRGDLGITYDRDVIRLIDVFRGFGLYVSSVVLTRFHGQTLAKAFQSRLEGMGRCFKI